MKIGIKIKLAVVLSTLLFAATVSIGAMLVLQHKSDLEEQLRSMAGTITHEFANGSKMPFMQKDTLGMTLAVQNILKYPGIHDAYILNHRFEVEAHKDVLEAGGDFVLFDTGLIMARQGEAAPWTIDHGDQESITFASPIVFRDTTVGYTVVSFSKAFIREQVRRAVRRVTIMGFMAAGAVTLISIPLASGLLRPVFRLFQGTREIALGNFDYRIPEIRKDEIGDLVASFNRMASDLKKKEILRGVLNRYVSRHVADEIFRDPERVRLGGHRREVSVFFADIRGFTSMSRNMEPEEIVDLLNRYFHRGHQYRLQVRGHHRQVHRRCGHERIRLAHQESLPPRTGREGGNGREARGREDELTPGRARGDGPRDGHRPRFRRGHRREHGLKRKDGVHRRGRSGKHGLQAHRPREGRGDTRKRIHLRQGGG
ncbi:MAG: HAMP domain-containing protein [Deltaproteobacteria bacterium]|nr:HAMP domain-containing protein [Deltaproteobacteria bacterium]